MLYTPDTPARVLFTVDHPGWAFHRIASKVGQYLQGAGDPIVCQIALGGETRNEECDLLVALHWKDVPKLTANNRIGKVILCLYDAVTWCRSGEDAHIFSLACEDAAAIVVANQEIADMLRSRRLDKLPIFICEDGVDCTLFTAQDMPPRFAVGWAGNSAAGHRTIKGLELIKEACKMAEADLITADIAERQIPHDQMPNWLSNVSTYICASVREGTPNPVMEAAASARPIISTRVGLVPRLITDGISGYIVQRTAEDIAEAIRKVRGGNTQGMGYAARRAAEAHDWSHKLPSWRSAISSVLAL